MDYRLRPARADEWQALANIEHDAGRRFAAIGMAEVASGEPMPAAFARSFMSSGAAFVAGDSEGDLPVGFVLVGFLDRAAHIYELSVLEEHGRRGLGRRLLAEACRFAMAQSTDQVTLSTFRNVPWNGPFYERLGFVFLERRQWTPGLHVLRNLERCMGLPVERRAFMRKRLS